MVPRNKYPALNRSCASNNYKSSVHCGKKIIFAKVSQLWCSPNCKQTIEIPTASTRYPKASYTLYQVLPLSKNLVLPKIHVFYRRECYLTLFLFLLSLVNLNSDTDSAIKIKCIGSLKKKKKKKEKDISLLIFLYSPFYTLQITVKKERESRPILHRSNRRQNLYAYFYAYFCAYSRTSRKHYSLHTQGELHSPARTSTNLTAQLHSKIKIREKKYKLIHVYGKSDTSFIGYTQGELRSSSKDQNNILDRISNQKNLIGLYY